MTHQLTLPEHPRTQLCSKVTPVTISNHTHIQRHIKAVRLSKPMSSAVVLWVSITMNTVVLACSGPRCAARHCRIMCLLISPSICESPLQQAAAPSDELCAAPASSRPRCAPLQCRSDNEERASFPSSFNVLPWHIHYSSTQTETHTATLLSVKVWPWDVKKAANKSLSTEGHGDERGWKGSKCSPCRVWLQLFSAAITQLLSVALKSIIK